MHENIQSVSAWREKETASPAALTLKIGSWIILYIRPSTPHFAPSPSPSPPHPERGHEADSQESSLTSPLLTISQSQPRANLAAPSLDIRDLGPLVTCQRGGGVTFTAEMFSARVPECDWVVGWLPGALHCTVHCTLYTALYTWHRVTLPAS